MVIGIQTYRPFTIQFDVVSKRHTSDVAIDGCLELQRIALEAPEDCALTQLCCDQRSGGAVVLRTSRRVGGRIRLWALVPDTTTAERMIAEIETILARHGWSITGVGS